MFIDTLVASLPIYWSLSYILFQKVDCVILVYELAVDSAPITVTN